MATGRKDSNGPNEPRDEFDKLDSDEAQERGGDDVFVNGYHRCGPVIFTIDHQATEEELLERQRVLTNPQTLEEMIEAHIAGNIFELEDATRGRYIDDTFPPLIEGLEKCGITLEELLVLKPEYAVQEIDAKGRPTGRILGKQERTPPNE